MVLGTHEVSQSCCNVVCAADSAAWHTKILFPTDFIIVAFCSVSRNAYILSANTALAGRTLLNYRRNDICRQRRGRQQQPEKPANADIAIIWPAAMLRTHACWWSPCSPFFRYPAIIWHLLPGLEDRLWDMNHPTAIVNEYQVAEKSPPQADHVNTEYRMNVNEPSAAYVFPSCPKHSYLYTYIYIV